MSKCPNCGNSSASPLLLLKSLRHTRQPYTADGFPLVYCKMCGTIYVDVSSPNIELQKVLNNYEKP